MSQLGTLFMRALADIIHSTHCRSCQCYLDHVDELHYVSTVLFNCLPMSAVSNTILVMTRRKSLHITHQQEKELYKHLTRLLWKKDYLFFSLKSGQERGLLLQEIRVGWEEGVKKCAHPEWMG